MKYCQHLTFKMLYATSLCMNVDMRDKSVDMQLIYVDMHLIYVDM